MTQVGWVHMHTASKRIERKVLVAQIMKWIGLQTYLLTIPKRDAEIQLTRLYTPLLFTLKDTSRPIPTHGSTDAMD